jgi:hypothetical protein
MINRASASKATSNKWVSPLAVSKLDIAFGGRMKELLPSYNEIPDEFKDNYHPWCHWQSKWFFSGLAKQDIPETKAGIDKDAAMRHLAAIQGSFEPKHEHKEAGVAYLASLWFVAPPQTDKGS